jgi:predicted nucleic acid-binding protein
MIYLDSSALLKLLFEEGESAALAQWISEQTGTPMVTSELAKVEVVRAARRLDADVVPAARVLMSQLDLIPLSSGLLDEAADVGEPLLRTLDAIHLAGALDPGRPHGLRRVRPSTGRRSQGSRYRIDPAVFIQPEVIGLGTPWTLKAFLIEPAGLGPVIVGSDTHR